MLCVAFSRMLPISSFPPHLFLVCLSLPSCFCQVLLEFMRYSLEEAVDGGAVEPGNWPGSCLALLREVAAALKYLHTWGVAHGSLHPQVVFVLRLQGFEVGHPG